MPKKVIKDQSLVLIESPGKQAKLSTILGPKFVIKATFGHIMELSKTRIHNLGVDVTPGANYKIYKVISDSRKDALKSIIDATTNCKEILIATDADREGESIGADAAELLQSTGLPIYRIKFHEITKSAVLKAVENKQEIDYNLVSAASSRQVLDQIVGFLASPFVKKSFKDEKGMEEAKSAGRVQSVAVRLVIDREDEIANFKPEEYWNIFANLAKKSELDKKINAKYTEKVNNKTDALKIKSELESDSFSVIKVDAKEKKRPPFPPLITSTLQITCSNRYNMSVDTVMSAAQKIYESGLITYMRTDSTHVSPEAIQEVREWLTDNKYNIPTKPNQYASKSGSDAHECIRPTHIENHPDNINLPPDQKKVYQIIWEKFVCSQMDPALYDTLSIIIKSSSNHELKTSGRTLKYPGWLAIATDQVSVKSEDEDDITLPNLSVGDNLILIEPKVVATQKWTTPPPRYGEGIFIKELEKRGIGRPSTYGSTVLKIKDRGYVEIKNKVYHGTESGKKVTEKLSKYFKFLDYMYTAEMEEKLDLIAAGKLTYVEMIDEFFKTFHKELEQAYLDLGGESAKCDIICNKCNKNTTIIRHGQYGFYIQCTDLSCKGTQSVDVVDGKTILKDNFTKNVFPNVSCPKCNGDMVKKQGKWGDFLSCVEQKCGGTSKVPYGKKCPKCSKELYSTIYQGDSVLFCMGYPNCYHREDLKKEITNPNNYSKIDDIPKQTKKIFKKASKKSV
jgi:DNA topoisomerase I